jgi:hypothetical protein
VHSLEPISSKKFEKFLRHILCEERGMKGNLKVYWRADRKQPITFNATGDVPMAHILLKNIKQVTGTREGDREKALEIGDRQLSCLSPISLCPLKRCLSPVRLFAKLS